MKYDVLHEPWITARHPDGIMDTFGIYDLLCSAHELTEIVDANPHFEFGVYRMLFVFLMDAYRPQDQDAILDLLKEGRFDPEVLDRYINTCRSEGVTFDLFDPDRPFLQCGESEWEADAAEKTIAVLNPVVPSGNNHVHFDHTFAKVQTMTLPDAAKALCAVNLFSTAGAQGYPSTPNGAPPLYCMVKGNNLFETLVWGMVPANQYERYAEPSVIWRWKGKIEAKAPVASTSLLYGLLFPCRRVRLMPGTDEGQTVSKVFFEQGMNYQNYAAWIDPHVAYRKNKNDETVNIKPNMTRESWRDLDSLIHYKNGAPAVVNQYLDIVSDSGCAPDKRLALMTYAVVTNQAAYLDMKRGEYSVPVELARSEFRYKAMQGGITELENGGGRLSFALQCLQKELREKRNPGAFASEANRTLDRYFFTCRQRFLNEYCPALAVSALNELDDILSTWKETIIQLTVNEYDSFADRMGAAATILLAAQSAKGCLYATEEKKKESKKNKDKKKG